jgi:predicted RecB family endonuclease
MLGDLIARNLGFQVSLPEPSLETTVTTVRDAIVGVEDTLVMAVQSAQQRLEDTRAEKASHDANEQEAAACLSDLENKIAQAKAGVKESARDIESRNQDLETLKSQQAASEGGIKAAAKKVERLYKIDQSSYKPLKEVAAAGTKGHQQLKGLQKIGKEFGFQNTLLASVPEVLKKSLSKRVTFDGHLIDALESEFSKHYGELESALKEEQSRFQECARAIQDTQVKLLDSKQARNAYSNACTEAEKSLASGRTALTTARRGARKLEVDSKKLMQDLVHAETRLEAFRSGVMAAFETVQQDPALPNPVLSRLLSTLSEDALEVLPGCSADVRACTGNKASSSSAHASAIMPIATFSMAPCITSVPPAAAQPSGAAAAPSSITTVAFPSSPCTEETLVEGHEGHSSNRIGSSSLLLGTSAPMSKPAGIASIATEADTLPWEPMELDPSAPGSAAIPAWIRGAAPLVWAPTQKLNE